MFCLKKSILINNLLSTILIFSTICWKTCTSLNITQLFIRHLVIPNMVPYAPEEVCQVVFPTKTNISIGHSYFVFQILGQPNVTWTPKENTYYTLYLSGATHREIIYPDKACMMDNFLQFPNTRWTQWLICNIRGNDLSTGQVLIPYTNFTEPENPAIREVYFFFVLAQANHIYADANDRKFNLPYQLRTTFAPITRFMEKHNSTLEAVNFFYLANEPAGINDIQTEATQQTQPKISMLETLLKTHHIIPDLIPHTPDQICTIKYRDDQPYIEPGKKYNQSYFERTGRPKVEWAADPKSLYTLYFFAASEYSWFINETATTPEPPTGYYKTEWIMWLVGNIPGNNTDAGQTVYEYASLPLPSEDFPQLYIVLIFEQPRKFNFEIKTTDRESIRLGDHDYTPVHYFMHKYELIMNLVAANFFLYENDYWTHPRNRSDSREYRPIR